ncbi:DNA repair protein RecO [Thermosinus carboxydivorans Nor1]|uniref:DNA repair protein RecO n=1 Tax=Thermosinus carboxydivorans Nor1 TaxID=401526 RepID=A1HPC5_9FIRM|nr:DNA repair protein RecO [Thermosinus carboxydivorans]EAX48231.1 DNA repair protein RecO [Thermosinus carboxydivorans Nor1]
MTQEYSVEAILLTVRDCGTADRMVTLFSRQYGKIAAVAFGARRPKSSFAGCLQPFSHVDLLLVRNRGGECIRQCEIIRGHRKLREELPRMVYTALVAEIVTELWPEHQPDPEVFELLLDVLSALEERNPRVAAIAAAWQLLALAGFAPEYRRCVACGSGVSLPAHFNIGAGGVMCPACGGSQASFTEGQADLLTKFLTLDFRNPGRFTVNAAALADLEKLLGQCLVYHLEKELKTWNFIRRFERPGTG